MQPLHFTVFSDNSAIDFTLICVAGNAIAQVNLAVLPLGPVIDRR